MDRKSHWCHDFPDVTFCGLLVNVSCHRNCAPYLRVSTGGLPSLSNLELGVLDNSRIHPESYRIVTSLVSKATGDDDVEAAVDNPSKVGRRV